ncbi:glycosyltransferase [Streptococcus oralis]|uniref:Putative UDP-galactose--lipooligosaccharide galactosyltransferase n=1 Tax=Streptococcus oralis TaxID=1303 RepID=A0A139PFG9_STROR|nr:glycosyltransferase [Streptococcus oralis]KXT87965.1 putative UDP-galactose--lipooligosaccharide galactosyltransferase [Streptococcus oralis]
MPEKQKISVLMSVYVKENPAFLRDAIKSVQNQTFKPSELVLVEDGQLTPELYQVLDEVEAQSEIPVKRCPLEENQGLGLALRYGVLQCQYDIIARMDTDDLAVPDRFEKQLQLMEKEDLDLLGGHIAEFIDNPDEIVSYRRVPTQHADIVAYQRMRSAFNHMTVMFKKDMVLKAGNYEDGLYMEDDLLWLNMIAAGAKTGNLDQILCKVRVGAGMFERRGGLRYLKLYRQARQRMLERGQISYMEYAESIVIQSIVALCPGFVRQFIFVKLLRKNK